MRDAKIRKIEVRKREGRKWERKFERPSDNIGCNRMQNLSVIANITKEA